MNHAHLSSTARISNIEILRIVCMVMIILFHYYLYGAFSKEMDVTASYVVMQLLSSGSKIGVDVFVVITGYFLITQEFRWLKLCKFFSCTYFWSLVILAFAIFMFGVDQLAPDRILESLFPLTPLNWFARSYFILYIMFPLLNRFIFRVSRRTLGCVILVLTMYFYVVPTVLGGTRGGYGNSTFMFADMYMIGAYIRQYGNERLAGQLKIAGVLGLIVLASSVLFFDYMGLSDPFYRIQSNVLSCTKSGENVFALMAAMGLFVWAKDVRMAFHPRINTIAATTFGIYLIHDNSFVSMWLWNDVMQGYRFYDTPFAVPHMILSAAAVFAVCSGLEYIRIRLVERPLMRMLGRRIK